MMKRQREQPRLSGEMLQRLRATGLTPEDMTDEQLEAFESLEEPEKYHWFAKLFIYIGGGLGILVIVSIFSADWELVLGYGILGLIVWYVAYRIQTRVAAKRFQQASIRKDITRRLRERKIPAQRITYVPGQYCQLKLLDGTRVFLETLPDLLRIKKMITGFIPTRTIWQHQFPFYIRTAGEAWELAREILDLALKSVERCKTLDELKQTLNNETSPLLDAYAQKSELRAYQVGIEKLGSFAAKKYLVSSPKLRDIVMTPSEVREIIGDYGEVLEASGEGRGLLLPISKLPHPKEKIREALNTALKITKDEEMSEHLKVCLVCLDDFVPDEEVPTDPVENIMAWAERQKLKKTK